MNGKMKSNVGSKVKSMVAVLTILSVATPVLAGGHVVSRGMYTSAYAWASAYYASDTDSEHHWGRRSDAEARADGRSGSWGEADVWARTWGRAGGWANGGNGGTAGPDEPFGPQVAVPGIKGEAEVEFDCIFGDDRLTLEGELAFNSNGFVEITVFDATGMSNEDMKSLDSEYPSIDAVLKAEALDPERILGYWRESQLTSDEEFSLDINLEGVKPENVAVFLVVHAISSEVQENKLQGDEGNGSMEERVSEDVSGS